MFSISGNSSSKSVQQERTTRSREKVGNVFKKKFQFSSTWRRISKCPQTGRKRSESLLQSGRKNSKCHQPGKEVGNIFNQKNIFEMSPTGTFERECNRSLTAWHLPPNKLEQAHHWTGQIRRDEKLICGSQEANWSLSIMWLIEHCFSILMYIILLFLSL